MKSSHIVHSCHDSVYRAAFIDGLSRQAYLQSGSRKGVRFGQLTGALPKGLDRRFGKDLPFFVHPESARTQGGSYQGASIAGAIRDLGRLHEYTSSLAQKTGPTEFLRRLEQGGQTWLPAGAHHRSVVVPSDGTRLSRLSG